jgi:hypothetical protein
MIDGHEHGPDSRVRRGAIRGFVRELRPKGRGGEDIAREYGQQVDGTRRAEHGKHIEGDGAEDDFLVPDKGESFA